MHIEDATQSVLSQILSCYSFVNSENITKLWLTRPNSHFFPPEFYSNYREITTSVKIHPLQARAEPAALQRCTIMPWIRIVFLTASVWLNSKPYEAYFLNICISHSKNSSNGTNVLQFILLFFYCTVPTLPWHCVQQKKKGKETRSRANTYTHAKINK